MAETLFGMYNNPFSKAYLVYIKAILARVQYAIKAIKASKARLAAIFSEIVRGPVR